THLLLSLSTYWDSTTTETRGPQLQGALGYACTSNWRGGFRWDCNRKRERSVATLARLETLPFWAWILLCGASTTGLRACFRRLGEPAVKCVSRCPHGAWNLPSAQPLGLAIRAAHQDRRSSGPPQ